MNGDQIAMWYFIIGISYALVNGFIRKLDTDGDYMLGFVWVTLWPLAFASLFIHKVIEAYKKIKNPQKDL